jgi:nitrogen-specific signal transduction histidine kinase
LDLHLVESVTLPGLTGLSTLTAVNGQPSAVRITVEDNGTGIPEHLHQRIFEPSFTTKPTDRGTGLGLAISKDIVEDHDGELSLESHPGHWTRFHVDLPAKPRAFGGTGLRTSSGHSAENCGSDWTREMLACQTQN